MTRLFAGTPFDRPPVCERCGKLDAECRCPPPEEPSPPKHLPPNRQTARLAVERRKRGKLVTVVRGLSAEANDLPALLARLKNACGAGGTLDGDTLAIQGNQTERLRALLTQIGYRIQMPHAK